jgi:hypothetical protein
MKTSPFNLSSLLYFVVFWGLTIDELRGAYQADNPIEEPKGLKTLGGKGHVIDRVFLTQDLNHPMIQHLKKGVRDPVVRIHEILRVKFQTVQESSQGPFVVFPDVHQQGPGDSTADFFVCGQSHEKKDL